MKTEQLETVTLFFKPGQVVRVIQMGASMWQGKIISEVEGRAGWYYVRASDELTLSCWTDMVFYGDLQLV